MFTLLKECGGARRGSLKTRHGEIQTPIFMPVGTQATVKGLSPAQIDEAGAQIILSNTYHLNIRPGSELIREMGGLHKFMNWNGPILTDSGGFQVFSLAKLRKISEQGIEFRSHLDGQKFFLDPKACYRIQANLDTDIAMVLDECPPFPCDRDDCERAVARTIRWAGEFLDHAREDGFLESGHQVFAILQGSTYDDLRQHCGRALAEMDFSGYAVGGVSVGEPEEAMLKQVAASAPVMPAHKPRYVMGVGTPPQLLQMIALGMDMFDCVMPTRLARHATVFTPHGPLNLKNERFKHESAPIMEADNYTCRHFSCAYLRHLVMAKELLAHSLLSLHNVHFFLDLMAQARAHIEAGDYASWSQSWIERYNSSSREKGY
ncbi:MAG: tRNA guanosine(34) transglycosylase Tgt [Opitutales bacterium]